MSATTRRGVTPRRHGSRHFCLVFWGFPPFRGSGTFRPLAIANGLAATGVDVTVVTTTREPFLIRYGADPELEREIDPAIEVVRVPFFPERSWPQLNDWPRVRAFRPKVHAAAMERRSTFPEKIYPPWLPRARQAVFEVHQRHPITALLGSGVPYVDFEIAAQAAAEIGVPLVLDDRDAFLLDVFTGDVDPRYDQRLPYWQRWSHQAAELWFVNPPIADWHVRQYPGIADRIRVVENGWDAGAVPDPASRTPRRTDGPVHLGYVGLVPTNFPLRMLLDVWAHIRRDLPEGSWLHFVGPLGYEVGSAAWRRAEEAIESAPHVRWDGHVSRQELAPVYEGLDVLLLVKEGGAMVTGGKTYEYAVSGLAIAAVVDQASDALRVLADHPRVHVAESLRPGDAEAAIRAAVTDARTDDGSRLRAAVDFGRRLERRRLLQPHLERLVELA